MHLRIKCNCRQCWYLFCFDVARSEIIIKSNFETHHIVDKWCCCCCCRRRRICKLWAWVAQVVILAQVAIKHVNENCQKSNSNEYTIKRKLRTTELTNNSLVCDDFHGYHKWWNSWIASSIWVTILIKWLNKFNCELINILDQYTFIRDNSNSVFDLTFATTYLASKIINW